MWWRMLLSIVKENAVLIFPYRALCPHRMAAYCALFALFLCLGAVNGFGRTIAVSPRGLDTGPGTESSPWQTLARANAAVQPGDTVLVHGGTYHEQIVPARTGQRDAPILYLAAPGEDVVVDGTTDNLIVVYVGDYTTVEGFTIKSQAAPLITGVTDNWVNLVGDHITLRRCRVIAEGDPKVNYWQRNQMSRGVLVFGHFVTVEHCFIRGQQMGLEVGGSAPRFFTMRFDTLLSHGASNLVITSPYGNEKVDTTMQRNLVEYCVMDTSWEEDNIQFEPSYIDHSIPCNRGTIVRHCRLGHAAENAVDLKGGVFIVLDNNLMYSSEGDNDGLRDGGDDVGGPCINLGANESTRYVIARRNAIWDNHTGAVMYDGYHFYNNVFLNNRRSFRGPNGDDPFREYAGVTCWTMPNYNRSFVNNIVGDQPNSGTLFWKMDYGSKFYINNNLYFETGGRPKFYHRVSGSLTTTTGVDNWQALLSSYSGYSFLGGKDQASVEGNPQFVNVPAFPTDYDPTWDFRLSAGSPGIEAGMPVTFARQGETESTSLLVDDPYFFTDGYGIVGGDSIRIGNSAPVQILSIDFANNILELSEPRSWSAGEGVHLTYNGSAPDIGMTEGGTEIINAPSTPGLLGPDDGAVDLPANVTLRWSRVPEAATYGIQVSLTLTFASPVMTRLNQIDTSFVVQGLLPSSVYYWRARSSNAGGSSGWSTPRSFVTGAFAPTLSPPSPYTPVNGASGLSTNLTISWLAVLQAAAYDLQVSGSSSFTSTLLDRSGLTSTSSVVDGLGNNATYYWRVRAVTAGATSAWSDVMSFSTFAVPSTLSGNALANANFENGTSGWAFSTNGVGAFSIGAPGFHKETSGKVYISESGTNAQLSQTGIVVSPDSTYRLRFAAFSTTGDDLEVSLKKQSLSSTAYGLDAYRVDLTSEWKVYSIDFKPSGFASPVNDARLVFTFNRYSAPGDVYALDYLKLSPINGANPPPPDDVPLDYNFDGNYPNPFNPATTLRYGIPSYVHVTIKVYNLIGQEVTTLVDGFQEAGVYDVRLDMSRFASGMYLCMFRAGEYKQTRKIMYVK
jgi:hypothetical protein